MGEGDGSLNYIENTGTSTAPVFVRRTGSANPFDVDSTPGICATSWTSAHNEGCQTAQSGCPPVACDWDDGQRWCCNEGFEESCDEWHYCGGIDVGQFSTPALGDLDGDGTLRPCPSIDKL